MKDPPFWQYFPACRRPECLFCDLNKMLLWLLLFKIVLLFTLIMERGFRHAVGWL